MKQLKNTAQHYFPFFLFTILATVGLRIIEFVTLWITRSFSWQLLGFELIGMGGDFALLVACQVIAFPIYALLHHVSAKWANGIFVGFTLLFVVAHLVILRFFIAEHTLLNAFIFRHSFQEVFYTIQTSGVSIWKNIAAIILFCVLLLFLYRWISGKKSNEKRVSTYLKLWLFIPLGLAWFPLMFHINNPCMTHKAFYFYTQSISFLFEKEEKTIDYSEEDSRNFWQLYPHQQFLNGEYPMLHQFMTPDSLSSYFHPFEAKPNIVILIVEGLNDDFIHDYKEVMLMPFLNSLVQKSLYWNRCFTLGERSFAAVPSLLGGLPYGNEGFTFIDPVPRHLTLPSLLKANNYFTAFFYGQGSWFHKKNRFFNYNNTDLIFDNSDFDTKYHKIIVGDDNFFWGYNDKDLFNQSLAVLDTIAHRPQFSVYFTGTTHPPFVINDENLYEQRFKAWIKLLHSNEDIAVFTAHKKEFKTIGFMDDALRDFFAAYAQRSDFNNTIFIITGDHPMTEIPIANLLKRYHVPFIIYSPALKETGTVPYTVSHLDLYETLLAFLQHYDVKTPRYSTSLGNHLFLPDDGQNKRFVFMDGNRHIIDYYANGYYWADGKLFQVTDNFDIIPQPDNITPYQNMAQELSIFKKTNTYVSFSDKLIPDSLYIKSLDLHPYAVSSLQTVAKSITTPYHGIVSAVKVSGKPMIYDIFFNFSNQTQSDISIIYTLTTEQDSVVLWQSQILPKDKTFFQGHYKIPQQFISDSTLIFSSYLWNVKEQEIKYNNLKFILYPLE
ncbi:MAG: sulfatase-like hydrolase/transferase [Bacteroidales bacterium]|nr:sulfatase-like hydrolase/transferase [Bacteroidales bacterium]